MSTNGGVMIIGFKTFFEGPPVADMALLWEECNVEHL
jgi:hypothetical protein